ncbi:MAG: ABC transporter permease [Acidobacteriota bacterium]
MLGEAGWADLRTAVRGLRRSRGFLIAALTTLTLGIGASTAVYSVFRSVLLRPLPFPDSGRLVRIFESSSGLSPTMAVAYPNYVDWVAGARKFSSLSAYRPTGVALTGVGEARRLDTVVASANFLETLGLRVRQGRFFLPAEDRRGGDPVVVISHALWRDQLDSDPGVLQRSLTLDGRSYSVIGVLPPGFALPGLPVDAILPVVPTTREDRDAHQLRVVARLAEGSTMDSARAELDAIARRLATAYPATNAGQGVTLSLWLEIVVGDVRPTLRMLLAAVGFVALIACVNLSNLLLARGLARAGETAVRSALGASRLRLLTLAVGESLTLASVGCVLGIGFAWSLLRVLVSLHPPGLARLEEVRLDGGALAMGVAMTVACAVLAGAVPGWLGSLPDLRSGLQGAARGSGDSSRRRLRQALVAAQVGIALVLLLGAGLALRSLGALRDVATGFDPRNVLTAHLDVAPPRVPMARIAEFYQRLGDRLNAQPGVEAAGSVDFLPFSPYDSQTTYRLEGQPEARPGEETWTDKAVVGGRYFQAMRIALLRGRLFDARDAADAPPRVLVDRRFVERNFPSRDPLGQRVVLGDQAREIIGVVEHVRAYGLDRDPRVQVYLPTTQTLAAYAHVVVRSAPGGLVSEAQLRTVIHGLDADLPVEDVRTMTSLVAGSLAERRFSLLLLGAFAGAALFLAAVGIYGVLSYSVVRRKREVGVRRALGADRGSIVSLFIGEGLRLAALGAVGGIVAALPLLNLMRGLLFGVGTLDSWTWLTALGAVLCVVILAAAIPAGRAAVLEPAEALRQE